MLHAKASQRTEEAQVHDHLCLLYHGRAEALAGAIPFVKAGLEQHDLCAYIADDNTTVQVVDSLKASGVDVAGAIGRGQLLVATKSDSYLAQHYFDPEQAIDFFIETATQAVERGFRALRGIGEMTWQLGREPGVELFGRYESKLNDVFPEHRMLGFCQYNLDRFSPDAIQQAIHTHPKIVISGVIVANPYYRAPGEFECGPHETAGNVAQMLGDLYGLAGARAA